MGPALLTPRCSSFKLRAVGALPEEVSFSSLEDDVPLVEKFKKYFGTGGIRSNEVFPPPRSANDIKEFLIARLGARLNMRPGQTLTDETQFEDLGINSLALVKFSLELEEWLDIEIEPTLLIEHSNIRELSLALDNLRVHGCQSRSAQ
jgi:acyl carrier protein